MQEHDKAWSLYVFSSANVLRSYTIEQLVGLGVSWVWMGLEGEDSQYTKLHGTDAQGLVRFLQSHGIRVLGSSIIGLENHTPENIDAAIDFAVRYDTDFHQFMLYTPIPGTPLHAELTAKGIMKDESEFHPSDIHGQYIFNYRHAHIKNGQETDFVLRAFQRDFEVNGPSVMRIVRTTLAGWKRYKNHPDARIRRHYAWEARELGTTFSALVGAVRLYYRDNPRMAAKADLVLQELRAEFGLKSRFYAAVGGRYVLHTIRQEEKRLARGWTYEPPTLYEANFPQADARALCLGRRPRGADAGPRGSGPAYRPANRRCLTIRLRNHASPQLAFRRAVAMVFGVQVDGTQRLTVPLARCEGEGGLSKHRFPRNCPPLCPGLQLGAFRRCGILGQAR